MKTNSEIDELIIFLRGLVSYWRLSLVLFLIFSILLTIPFFLQGDKPEHNIHIKYPTGTSYNFDLPEFKYLFFTDENYQEVKKLKHFWGIDSEEEFKERFFRADSPLLTIGTNDYYKYNPRLKLKTFLAIVSFDLKTDDPAEFIRAIDKIISPIIEKTQNKNSLRLIRDYFLISLNERMARMSRLKSWRKAHISQLLSLGGKALPETAPNLNVSRFDIDELLLPFPCLHLKITANGYRYYTDDEAQDLMKDFQDIIDGQSQAQLKYFKGARNILNKNSISKQEALSKKGSRKLDKSEPNKKSRSYRGIHQLISNWEKNKNSLNSCFFDTYTPLTTKSLNHHSNFKQQKLLENQIRYIDHELIYDQARVKQITSTLEGLSHLINKKIYTNKSLKTEMSELGSDLYSFYQRQKLIRKKDINEVIDAKEFKIQTLTRASHKSVSVFVVLTSLALSLLTTSLFQLVKRWKQSN